VSSEGHRRLVEEVASIYDSDRIIAKDAIYPGIFSCSVDEHEAQGRVDLMVDIPERERTVRIIEASNISTLVPEFIENKYIENAEQLQNHVTYFESLGYEVEPEVELRPSGKLLGLKNFWENTTGVATWETVREAIGDDDLLNQMRQKDIIVCYGKSELGNELYGVNEEIEQYGELIDIFNQDLV